MRLSPFRARWLAAGLLAMIPTLSCASLPDSRVTPHQHGVHTPAPMGEPILDLDVAFEKGEILAVQGTPYEKALKEEQKHSSKPLVAYDAEGLASWKEPHRSHVASFEAAGSWVLPAVADEERIGYIEGPGFESKLADGRFAFQTFRSSESMGEVLAQLKALPGYDQIASVVVFLVADDGRLLIHHHKEPADAWGFNQDFWSVAGGMVEGGVINTALTELHEESGYQIPDRLTLRRVRLAPMRRGPKRIAFIYFQITAAEADALPLPSEPSKPFAQFTLFNLKVSRQLAGQTDKVRAAFPRPRGSFDYHAVRWGKIDLNQRRFVTHPDIAGDKADGRFGTFVNPAIRDDLAAI